MFIILYGFKHYSAKHLPFDDKASATPLVSSTNSLSSNFGTKKVKINNIFSIRITLLSSVCNVAAKKQTSIPPALVCALKGIERCFSFRPLLQVAFSYCMIVRRTCSNSLIVIIRRFRTVFHLILLFFFVFVLLSFIFSATFY